MNPYYSEAERATLRSLYPTASQASVLAALPGRNWKSISQQAGRLYLKRQRQPKNAWTPAEQAILRQEYPLYGSRAVAQLTGRTPRAIRSQAAVLNLRSEVSLLPGGSRARPNSLDYTVRERQVLFVHYPAATRQQIEALLPTRPWKSIQSMAARLKIRRTTAQVRPSSWTEQELRILGAEYPSKGSTYVAKLLGCSKGRVLLCARRLQLVRLAPERPIKPMPVKAEKPAKVAKVAGPTRAEKKLLAQAQKAAKAAAKPVKRAPATPTVDVRAEQRRLAAKQQEQKPKPFVTAADFQGLGATHPARIAYTREARNGPQAATDAFRAAMQQYQKPA